MALRVGPIPQKCNVSKHGITQWYYNNWAVNILDLALEFIFKVK